MNELEYMRKRDRQQRNDEFWEQVALLGTALQLVATLVSVARRLTRR